MGGEVFVGIVTGNLSRVVKVRRGSGCRTRLISSGVNSRRVGGVKEPEFLQGR